MPYDATIEIDEFRFMDTRDRPERDYRERDTPQRPIERVDRVERESQYDYYQRTQPGVFDREGRRINPLVEAVNNPGVTVTPAEVKAINDPKKMMLPSGQIVSAGRSPLYPPLKTKRTRRKTKMDKTMSRCLKEANAKYRKKNGQLKKGKTMSDVMRLAHRLCRKENGTKKGMVRKTARRAYERK